MRTHWFGLRVRILPVQFDQKINEEFGVKKRTRYDEGIRWHEITDKASFLNRREFMKQAGKLFISTGLLAVATPFLSRAHADENAGPLNFDDTSRSRYSSEEEPNIFEEATNYNNFYEFGTGKQDPARRSGDFKSRPWLVSIGGEINRPMTLDIDHLIRLFSLEERIYRLRCVEAWSMVIPWLGFPLMQLIREVEPTSKAKYIEFETLFDPDMMPGQRRRSIDWPYVEALRLDEAMNPLTLMAVGMYGDMLPAQNGAPMRLIVPWKYGFKSVKSIVSIRFVSEQPKTSWSALSPREYGFYANVNPDVDHPRWSQKTERRIGKRGRLDTLPFNGYGEYVAHMYEGMNPATLY